MSSEVIFNGSNPSIKSIFDEISSEGGSNMKMEILAKYKDNIVLRDVLYLANSKRVKFFIKQIPSYIKEGGNIRTSLYLVLTNLKSLYTRQVTGNAASDYLKNLLESLSSDDAYILERIIEKDCKIGMGTTNINKVFPTLIEKTYYMGALPYNVKKAEALFANGEEAIAEVKADGRYVNVDINGGEVELISRAGEETLIGDSILLKDLSLFEDCVLNGELVIDGIDRMTGNGLITSIIDINKKLRSEDVADHKKAQKSIDNMKKRHNVIYSDVINRIRLIVWDVIDRDSYFTNINDQVRINRLNRLSNMLETHNSNMISLVEYKFVKSLEEALTYLGEVLERGEEGIVLKAKNSGVWKSGKHNYQLKLKVEFDLDLKIIECNYGTKGTKNENVISTVTCVSSCGKLIAKAQGIPEEMMEYITENQDNLIGTIAKVKCNGLSSNRNGGFSVLYPTLLELRDDKLEANTYDECVEIEASATGLK